MTMLPKMVDLLSKKEDWQVNFDSWHEQTRRQLCLCDVMYMYLYTYGFWIWNKSENTQKITFVEISNNATLNLLVKNGIACKTRFCMSRVLTYLLRIFIGPFQLDCPFDYVHDAYSRHDGCHKRITNIQFIKRNSLCWIR